MAHLHKKIKKAKHTIYIREIARVDGKLKVINQLYLGSAEKILSMAMDKQQAMPEKIQVQEFGALFLANLVENKVKVAQIIDSVISVDKDKKGPSIGEYFLYAVFNRMIEPKSKASLSEWYKKTAIQSIRPVDLNVLDSRRYWKSWEQVSKEDIERIAHLFFQRVNEK